MGEIGWSKEKGGNAVLIIKLTFFFKEKENLDH